MKLIDLYTRQPVINGNTIERYQRLYEIVHIDFINKSARIREIGKLMAWTWNQDELENDFNLRFVE